jgi:hypothetical protein
LGDTETVRQKVIFGIFIFLGFAVVTTLYLVVMSGTADISGTISVDSRLISWTENPPGPEDMEMVSANGYCIKGPDTDNRMLLSTKNKHKTDKLKYSFIAKEGMRHLIVIYLQLDHLTGDVGQSTELHVMTNIIKKGDLKRDFIITFKEKNSVDYISIIVTGEDLQMPIKVEYPISEIPDIIKL